MNSTSVFTYTGNANATLNTLTQVVNPDTSKTLANLVADVKGATVSTAVNQTIFMNQPMSWWLLKLTSGAVKYMPISNTVNWGYVDASGAQYYIGRPISDLMIPNKVSTMSVDRVTGVATIYYEGKLGFTRVDTREGPVPPTLDGAKGSPKGLV